jgi:uncharacterized SAM-binding protein YcdF (DUF218 family)
MLVLALTPAPFYMHRALGTDPNKSQGKFTPEYIVMLGGGGMPSEDNLIRLYYTSEYANYYQIPVIIIHPDDSISQVKMSNFLVANGVLKENINYLVEGTNTRSQILCFLENFPQMADRKLLIITSPQHITRTVKCFNKAGFTQVHSQATFDATVDFDLSLKKQKLDGNKYIPEINNTNIRYTFWNYIKLEIICIREYFALGYYKIKNWI